MTRGSSPIAVADCGIRVGIALVLFSLNEKVYSQIF
jgi:hypothetical protein